MDHLMHVRNIAPIRNRRVWVHLHPNSPVPDGCICGCICSKSVLFKIGANGAIIILLYCNLIGSYVPEVLS